MAGLVAAIVVGLSGCALFVGPLGDSLGGGDSTCTAGAGMVGDAPFCSSADR